MPTHSKPCRIFPKTAKSTSVDRIIALEKGLRRKHPKLSHAGTKSTSRAPSFAMPDAQDCYIAKRYRRTLSHLS